MISKFKYAVIAALTFILNSICFADVIFYDPNEYWGMVQNHRTGDWWDKNVLNEKIILSWIVIAVIIVLLIVALRVWKNKKRMIIFAILSLLILIGHGCFCFYIYNEAMEYPDQRRPEYNSFYNYRFLQYEGENTSNVKVKALITLVMTHNLQNEEVATYGEIEIVGDVKTPGVVSNGKLYTIEIIEYNAAGYVSKIRITEQ